MFVTITDVKRITGYDVTVDQITSAQYIIESYIGHIEAEVNDATDKMLLSRATAYQVAYMKDDPVRIFEQVSVKQIGQFGQLLTFRDGDKASPFVAPLAVLACRNVSWRKMRSVRTGTIYGRAPEPERWDRT